MPIKYIGRTTNFEGKTLWEVLGNLKNFGVGRMLIRHRFQRYPEPCYIRILKVAALPAPESDNPHAEVRKVVALVESTFRGQRFPKPIQIDSVSYKADYKLIPKDEEERYCNTDKVIPEKVLPGFAEFPPILRELLSHQDRKGTEKPLLKIKYNLTTVYNFKIMNIGPTSVLKQKF